MEKLREKLSQIMRLPELKEIAFNNEQEYELINILHEELSSNRQPTEAINSTFSIERQNENENVIVDSTKVLVHRSASENFQIKEFSDIDERDDSKSKSGFGKGNVCEGESSAESGDGDEGKFDG